MSRVRADRYTDRAGTGSPTFSEGVNVVGISSLGITTVTGVGQTALTVNGDARITGVLTVGQGSVTIDGTSGSSSITGVTTAGIGSVYGVDSINDLGFPTAGPLSNRNMIINGDCVISQRHGSGTADVNDDFDFPVDRVKTYASGDGILRVQRSDNAPEGFKHSAMVTVQTADASVASNAYYCIQQRIEGYNTAHLNWGTANAKTVTLSFWVRSSIAGTYGLSLWPSGQDYNYIHQYDINSADTWEYKTVTVPGPTAGTWNTTNGVGIGIWWDLGTGTNYNTTTYDTWGQNGRFRGNDQTPFITNASATFRLTGIQLEVGTRATPFEHRNYGDELLKCYRYYELWASSGSYYQSPAAGYNSLYRARLDFKVPKRATPDVTTYGINGYPNNSGSVDTDGVGNDSVTYTTISVYGFSIRDTSSPHSFQCGMSADAEL